MEIKRNIILSIGMIVGVALSGNSHALGEDGERALQILGGIYILEKIIDHRVDQRAPSREPWSSEEQRAYQEGVLARERERAAQRRHRAYMCGYTGRC